MSEIIESNNIVDTNNNNEPAKTQIEKPVAVQQQTQPNNVVNNIQENNTEKDISKYQGEIDALKEKLQEQQKQYSKIQQDMETMKEKQRKENILSSVKNAKFNIDNLDNEKMSSLDLMKQVIKENSSIDIEGKGQGYIEGVFETICKQGKENFDKKPAESNLPKVDYTGGEKNKPQEYLNTAIKRPAVS